MQFANFRREWVLSTACGLGNEIMAASFLRKGAQAFIAPSQEIEGNAALFFIIHFFYQLKKGTSLEEAFTLASLIDTETSYFKYYD